jgi:hypothetical protein
MLDVCFNYSPSLIRFVADLFHPVDRLAVQRFLDGDVVIVLAGVAPCQCFSLGANQITSPLYLHLPNVVVSASTATPALFALCRSS